eukprot:6492646-Amphidinium_carterae.2
MPLYPPPLTCVLEDVQQKRVKIGRGEPSAMFSAARQSSREACRMNFSVQMISVWRDRETEREGESIMLNESVTVREHGKLVLSACLLWYITTAQLTLQAFIQDDELVHSTGGSTVSSGDAEEVSSMFA